MKGKKSLRRGLQGRREVYGVSVDKKRGVDFCLFLSLQTEGVADIF